MNRPRTELYLIMSYLVTPVKFSVPTKFKVKLRSNLVAWSLCREAFRCVWVQGYLDLSYASLSYHYNMTLILSILQVRNKITLLLTTYEQQLRNEY